MPHIDLESYFARVGFRGARQASLESLRGLQAAHALAIPFENIDVIRGLGVRLDLPGARSQARSDRRQTNDRDS